jgi:hypothetical protein
MNLISQRVKRLAIIAAADGSDFYFFEDTDGMWHPLPVATRFGGHWLKSTASIEPKQICSNFPTS